MEFVAAVISKNSIKSDWVQKEISLAMTREIEDRRVTVLPLLIEKCTLPASLSDKFYADFTKPENFEREYSTLLRTLDTNSSKVVMDNKTSTRKSKIIPNRNQIVDICIIGVDRKRTQQDPKYSGLQNYYLQLSASPPTGWSNFFSQTRQFPRHTMWRSAWIEGDYIVINCSIDEIAMHLKDLKEDVVTTNKEYMQAKIYVEKQEQIEREQQKKIKKERDDLLDQLNFD